MKGVTFTIKDGKEVKHKNDRDIYCIKCGNIVHPSHYDDGPNNTLYTPTWVCTECLLCIDLNETIVKILNQNGE